MAEARGRAVGPFLAAVAATAAALQSGRALFHPKQGLDLAPPWLAAKLLLRGDTRFYDDAVVGAAGAALGLHGPAGPGDPVLNFIYPPWVPVAYVPLALLPWGVARVVWFLLSAAAIVLALHLAVRAVARDAAGERDLAPGSLVAAAFFFPVFYGLMTGQANGLLLLLLAGCLLMLRNGRGVAAGLLLAPAALLKPFLALPALVFLVRRAWGALAGFAAGAAALGLLGVVAGGPAGWGLWWAQISRHNALGSFEWRNHSIGSAALALFGTGGGVEPAVAAPGLVLPVAIGAGTLALFLALAALRPPAAAARPELGFGALLALGLLLAPKSWEHYGVFLLPVFLAVFAALRAEDGGSARVPLALLGVSFAVWAFALQSREEYAGLARRPLSLLLPAKTGATFLLLALAAWAAQRRGADGAPS
ncbi:MAG TPA: glycosyltransferase family 87 protein [Thermoanaerobaculia bacterium]|nr:glycosyltransferase family 87 protein [Thermoanaerobaculia bacterium]